jgi:hypothetical protein
VAKPHMSQAEQAVLLWPVLIQSARNQEILSYIRLAGLTGVARQGLGDPLGLIHRYCKSKKYPILNCIVVSREKGLPSEGLPDRVEPLDVFVEQSKVFVFGWSGKPKPRSEDFERLKS